jgi:hypothetical protein
MMFDRAKELAEGIRLRAGTILRERKERAAERKAEKRIHGDGHESRFWLLSIPATATLCAAFVEVYWATLFCIEATGSLNNDWAMAVGAGQPLSGSWHFAFDIRSVPVLIGLVAATIPIVMWSMVWLPVQMKARGTGRWRRVTMITAGLLANALVIVSGTVVMNSNRQEQVRAGQVVEQQAGQNRAAIQAQIDSVNGDLARLTDRRVNNEYAATAANVGADAYRQAYMSPEALARSPVERRDIIVRALGAASRADALRAQRTQLIGQLAAAPTTAAVAAHVEDHAGVGLDTFATYATVYRPPFVALICTIIGIFGTWWWVGLSEAMSRHNVSLSGWAPEDHRIEDLRAEDAIVPQPMMPPEEVIEDGKTKKRVDLKRPYYYREDTKGRKKKPKKGEPFDMEIRPEVPPDERGVEVDGAELSRIASTGVESSVEVTEKTNAEGDETAATEGNQERNSDIGESDAVHPEPSELTEEDAKLMLDAAANDDVVADEPQPDDHANDDHASEPAPGNESEQNHTDAANADDPQEGEGSGDQIEVSHTDPLDQGIAAAFADAQQQRQPITDRARLLEAAK